MKKPKLGSGKRFAQLTAKLGAKGAKNPKALAAFIGRKKFGNKKFNALAKHGKKSKSKPMKEQYKFRGVPMKRKPGELIEKQKEKMKKMASKGKHAAHGTYKKSHSMAACV